MTENGLRNDLFRYPFLLNPKMNKREHQQILKLYAYLRECQRQNAKRHFPIYLDYIDPNYTRQWFHTLIATKCQQLILGGTPKSRLMIFVPPQHGKSQIVSRQLPAWALGINPNFKIVGSSYSSTLAQSFSRAVQRTIDSPEYGEVFPDTNLNKSPRGGTSKGTVRTLDVFEVVGANGFYKAVGVGGSLTGTPVDLGIIDDPIKDALEAGSEVYRNRIWDWYTDVFLTRLHNNSKQILIMTRWHEDDLAGRLLKREPELWEVVRIPAIREQELTTPEDPRTLGEALWEERHSLQRLRETEERSPRTFASLYQQRPSIEGGNIVKKEWFQTISKTDFERIKDRSNTVHYFLDTAYTDKKTGDPSGIIATCGIANNLYIINATKVYLRFPDLIRFIPDYVMHNGYTNRSTLRIEPKANGISVIDQLRETTHINVTQTPTPTESKATRLFANTPFIESKRVVLVQDEWNEAFIHELCAFPNAPHDEFVDVLCYAIDFFFGGANNINLNRIEQLVY